MAKKELACTAAFICRELGSEGLNIRWLTELYLLENCVVIQIR